MCPGSGQRLKIAIAGVLILLAGGVGCSKRTAPQEGQADGAMRIVSMAPNLTEILFELGLDEEIVGVTRHCNYPPQARGRRQVGTFWQPDIEAVLASRPTLVIALGFDRQRQLADQLHRIGCTVLTVEDFERFEQLHDGILAIGQAVGRDEAARAMVERLTAAQAAIGARCADRPKRKVLWVIQREPLRVAGTKTFIHEMIELVGGVNAIGPTLSVYPPIGVEQVFASNPDVIIEPANMPEQRETQVRTAAAFYAAFKSISAVQNDAIYILDGDLVSRLGPRLDEALEQVARCVHRE